MKYLIVLIPLILILGCAERKNAEQQFSEKFKQQMEREIYQEQCQSEYDKILYHLSFRVNDDCVLVYWQESEDGEAVEVDRIYYETKDNSYIWLRWVDSVCVGRY